MKLGSEPFEGIRLFKVEMKKLMLVSLNSDYDVWIPGTVQEAYCHRAPAHKFSEPIKDCTCGIWACKSRSILEKVYPPQFESYRLVSARVTVWGVVIEHELGYRAQYARIIPNTIQRWPRLGFNFRQDSVVDDYQRFFGHDPLVRHMIPAKVVKHLRKVYAQA